MKLKTKNSSFHNDYVHYYTKILCTMGPAIASKQKIIELVQAGANAFRLNMSH